MAINKVTFGDEVLIDLTLDTVDDTTVVKGKLYHKPNGEVSEGTNTNNADTSADTVKEGAVLEGVTFHKADGTEAIGKLKYTYPNVVIADLNLHDLSFGDYRVAPSLTYRISTSEAEKIIPENIKKDVRILGVTGTLESGKKVVEGTITTTTSAQKVTLGFKPSVVYVLNNVGRNTYFGLGIFYADGTSIGSRMGASGGAVASPPVNVSILNDGFNIQSVTSNFNRDTYYVAIE